MENIVSPSLMQERYRNMHSHAIHGETPIETALILLREVVEGYEEPLDIARAARDLAKFEFRTGNPEWERNLEHSTLLLQDELDESEYGSDEEARILRELGATYGMCGRFELISALRGDSSEGYVRALRFFRAGKQSFQDSSQGKVFPDQYEINFAAMHVISERYRARSRRRSLRLLGRAALIAPLSESKYARHAAELSLITRLKRRVSSVGKTAFAGVIVAAPASVIKTNLVRKKTAKLLG